ncbi:MAG: hypothetical protein JWP97_2158 [Labilithrix sp.]|nr:hypothetical protein [Labilithrix sp.]
MDVDWTVERCLSFTDVLLEGELLELATTRSRQSFAERLLKYLRALEDDDVDDVMRAALADWIVEQPEVVELHASDQEIAAALDVAAAAEDEPPLLVGDDD